ncbi:hypothetical protein C8F04DRAFT_1408880 [Mycena alexandri]|uniref:Uncharacterized protein n=1 Tax=Mycena alexandri TaxID=1745969 RepID=A0AAD6RYZ8_9AGAR|nr:hypothetical protein C8F04DRAFT_1408880 [Mycena alexandri]
MFREFGPRPTTPRTTQAYNPALVRSHHPAAAMPPRQAPEFAPPTSPMPDINARSFKCPKAFCGRALKLKFETSGRHEGQFLLNCYTHHQDSKAYVYYFPKGIRPGMLATAVLPIGDSLPTSSVSAPAKPAGQCADIRCGNTRIHRHCANHMCKLHCDTRGNCPVHQPATPSASTSAFTTSPRTLPQRHRNISPLTQLARSAKEYSSSVPRFVERVSAETRRDAQRLEAEELAFMSSISSPILSQEERDYQLALLYSVSSASSPAPTTTSSASLGNTFKRTLTIIEWLETPP